MDTVSKVNYFIFVSTLAYARNSLFRNVAVYFGYLSQSLTLPLKPLYRCFMILYDRQSTATICHGVCTHIIRLVNNTRDHCCTIVVVTPWFVHRYVSRYTGNSHKSSILLSSKPFNLPQFPSTDKVYKLICKTHCIHCTLVSNTDRALPILASLQHHYCSCLLMC